MAAIISLSPRRLNFRLLMIVEGAFYLRQHALLAGFDQFEAVEPK
jgi:hypothetical protein